LNSKLAGIITAVFLLINTVILIFVLISANSNNKEIRSFINSTPNDTRDESTDQTIRSYPVVIKTVETSENSDEQIVVLNESIETIASVLEAMKLENEELRTKILELSNRVEQQTGVVDYSSIQWEVNAGINTYYGPYKYLSDFIIFYPNGTYNIISRTGTIKKNGRLERTVALAPIVNDFYCYYMTRDGALISYDMRQDVKRWETQLNIPSRLGLQETNDYVVFVTPDNIVFVVHKVTGIAIDRQSLSWSYPPITFNNRLYLISESGIAEYIITDQLVLNRTLDNRLGVVEGITRIKDELAFKNNIGQIILSNFDSVKVFNQSFIEKICFFENSFYMVDADSNYYNRDGSGKMNYSVTNELMYQSSSWQIDKYTSSINLTYLLKSLEFNINVAGVKDISDFGDLIFIKTDSTLYCRGIDW